ncbi:hypothetical protein [Moheibacter lacus]|uniref:Uncharacterized protein n=1 Tax=Moheibacter lacus TaxID=2745851 RepID=A0A838ZFN8_9FLAO|nr:hypothetical protein [Moheibacter lacus]MBA5628541.1 hypothetical protein [Moheibacter lacus]
MKANLLFFCLLWISYTNGQISTTRMNDIRINSSLSEVETAVGQKLELSKKLDDWLYTTTVNQKGSEIELGFTQYTDENGQNTTQLYEIKTKSSNIRTLSKLGIGSSLDDLWKAYKNYNVSIWNAWNPDTEKYSTTERVFQLNDNDAATALYFYLRNGKVYEIVLSFNEGC